MFRCNYRSQLFDSMLFSYQLFGSPTGPFHRSNLFSFYHSQTGILSLYLQFTIYNINGVARKLVGKNEELRK